MRIQNLLSLPLALCALAATLAAQDAASPYRFVPKDACFVARMSGPAAWKERFAGTQVAKLLKGPTLGPLFAEADKAIDAGLEELRKKGAVDVDALRKMLTDYAGEMVVAVQVDFTDIGKAMKDDEPPKMTVVLALLPDGRTDFAPVLDAVAKSAEETKTELRDLRVGDHVLRVAPGKDGMEFTVPQLVDGAVVMLVGNDLEQRAPKILGSEERWEAPAAEHSTFAMHVAAEAGLDALITAMAAQMEQEAPVDAKQLLTDLGLASLRSLDLSIGASGKYTDMALTLKFNEKERGLFGLLAAASGKPKLLGFVPAAAETYSVMPLDLGAFYRTVAKLWDAIPMLPMSREEGEAAFAERNKVRIKEDLFDHLGTEALMVTDSKAQIAAMEEDPDDVGIAGTAGALALRDGKAFGDALEKVIRANGLHAARKSEDYQGETVHRLTLFAMAQIEYCVAGDLLLIAGSDEGSKKELRSILDERAARTAGKPQAAFPAEVKERLASLPDGWSGFGAQSMQASLVTAAAAFELGIGHNEVLPPSVAAGFKQAIAVMRKVAADLPAFGLEQVVSTLHTSGDAWVSLSRW